MQTELKQLLTDMAERGEWRGADVLVEGARADLDLTRGTSVPGRASRPKWVFALAAATAVLIVIGGAALLFGGGEPIGDVVEEPTTIAPSTTVPAPNTTAVATPTTGTTVVPTTVPFVQEPMTWSRIPVEIDGQMSAVVAGGPGLIAAGASDGAAAIWTSSDGTVWQPVADDDGVFSGEGDTAYRIVDLVTAPGGYFAVGEGGDQDHEIVVWNSTDGLVWNRVTIDGLLPDDSGPLDINAMAAGPSGLVVVGWTTRVDEPWMLDDHFVMYSADGVVWQFADTSALPLGGMKDVVAAGPGYVAVGVGRFNTPGVWTSVDGQEWVLVDEADIERDPDYDDIYEMESVAVSDDGTLFGFGSGFAWMSEDGSMWTWLGSFVGEPEEGFASAWSGWPIAPVVTGDRIVVAGALEFRNAADPDRAAAWASTDGGATWERMSQPLDVFGDEGSYVMVDLVAVDGRYIAVGEWNDETAVWVGSWNEEG